jgi:hypothetical protein
MLRVEKNKGFFQVVGSDVAGQDDNAVHATYACSESVQSQSVARLQAQAFCNGMRYANQPQRGAT